MGLNNNLILYSANLAFIVTHLYGWLLKWYYRPQAYRDHFHELFPAQRAVGVIYLLQLFELPYLLQIGNPDALLYVNAFSLLFFSIQMLIMCEGYFFPDAKSSLRKTLLVIPAVIVLMPLFLQAVGLIALPPNWRPFAIAVVSVIFILYFRLSIREALKIRDAVRRANEDRYADSDDFPVRFANLIRWVPTLLLVLLAINFYADNVWVKFGRDILFIGANVWFCILTLNPWRKLIENQNQNQNHSVRDGFPVPENENQNRKQGAGTSSGRFCLRTNEEVQGVQNENEYFSRKAQKNENQKFDDLIKKLETLITEEKIFTEPHITSDLLISRLGTNTKYLAEVIRLSGYQSFYDMISQHRVRYAISLIHQNPNCRLAEIADQCGFSSQASMTKAFKAQGKGTPSSYRIVNCEL